MRVRSKTLLLVAFLGAAGLGTDARAPRGVLVVAVPEGSPAARAGLLPGDSILKGRVGNSPWRTLEGWYPWQRFVSEEAQTGTVLLAGRRAGRRVRWSLPAHPWGMETRPAVGAEAGEFVADALSRRASGDFASAAAAFQGAEGRVRSRDRSGAAWWLLLKAGTALGDAGDASGAAGRFEEARARARRDGEPLGEAVALRCLADLLATGGDIGGALPAYRSAVNLLDPASAPLGRARALLDLAWVENQAGHVEASAGHLKEGRELTRPLAPGSQLWAELALAGSSLAWKRGDFGEAEAWGQEALTVYRDIDPGSAKVAMTISHLGLLHFERGEVAAAERAFRMAVELWEAKRPAGMDPVPPLANLGMVLIDRGEFSEAERYLGLALEVQRGRAASSMTEAAVLNLLGVLRQSQGNLAGAEEFYTRALDLKRRLAPQDVETAKGLMNLGLILEERGRLDGAEALFRQSLAIVEASAPDSTTEAIAAHNLSHLLDRVGQDAEADAFLQRALRIGERVAPDSPDTANTRLLWAYRAWDAGDHDAAETRGREALRTIQASAAGGLREAEALLFLGNLRGELGGLGEGKALLERAIALSAREEGETRISSESRICLSALLRKNGAPEEGVGHAEIALRTTRARAPGGLLHISALREMALALLATGERGKGLDLLREAERLLGDQRPQASASAQRGANFAEKNRDLYQELMETLVDAGQPEEAFAVLERSRSRGLLAILATRDLDLTSDLPAEVDREFRVAEEVYQRAQDALEEDEVGPGGATRDDLLKQLAAARARRATAREAVRRANPRAAELRDPEPLGFKAARAELEEGTLLLAFAVGKERTLLFTLGPAPADFSARSLPTGEKALGREVRRLREGLHRGGGVDPITRGLSRTLLLPAKEPLARCRRLLVSPDGPLHHLPFSVLDWPGSASGRDRVADHRPLALVPSVTVYSELRRSAPASPTSPAQALGNPLYPEGEAADAASAPAGFRRAQSRGVSLVPLPATEREAESVRELGGDVQVWLGAHASEARARALPKEVRALHFACHAFADTDEPLESALLLSPPPPGEEGDGALEAWEILESIRVRCDLVVLSACETGAGKAFGGEGLLGLTRAFFYAGAKGVVASLWPVSDAATEELMGRFYRELSKGVSADEALRRAQVASGAAGGKETWAAFVLTGCPARLAPESR